MWCSMYCQCGSVCLYMFIFCLYVCVQACLCIFSIANLYWSFTCMRVCSTVWFSYNKISVNNNNSEVVKDLRFIQQCWWGFTSCGMWCRVAGYSLCFKGMCCLHHHHQHKEKSSCTSQSCKMQTSCSFKMPVTHYPAAQCNIPEDLNLQQHPC